MWAYISNKSLKSLEVMLPTDPDVVFSVSGMGALALSRFVRRVCMFGLHRVNSLLATPVDTRKSKINLKFSSLVG